MTVSDPNAREPAPRAPRASTPSADQPGARVGIDLVAVAEVTEAIEEFGDRYLRRIFTEGERATCGPEPTRAAGRLAERFAAKEAAIKVFRPEGGVTYTDIEVVSRPHGGSTLALHGRIGELARTAGLGAASVSMTHTAGYAAAVVAVAPSASADD